MKSGLQEVELLVVDVVRATVDRVFTYHHESVRVKTLNLSCPHWMPGCAYQQAHFDVEGEVRFLLESPDSRHPEIRGQVVVHMEKGEEGFLTWTVAAKIVCHCWEWFVRAKFGTNGKLEVSVKTGTDSYDTEIA
jgi:hypothetical protein